MDESADIIDVIVVESIEFVCNGVRDVGSMVEGGVIASNEVVLCIDGRADVFDGKMMMVDVIKT